MDHNKNEGTTFEEFDSRPLKKAKTLESSVMDDPLPSPIISTTSLDSECSESAGSKSDDQINGALSPVSELINGETVSADDGKQIVSEDDNKQPDDDKQIEDDNKQPDKPKNIINDDTYDYLPKGKIFT